MIQKSCSVFHNFAGHGLCGHDHDELEDDNHYQERGDDGKAEANDLVNLGAAGKIETAIRALLVKYEDVLVVFPHSGDLSSATGEVADRGRETGVLGGATRLHELLLVELGHHELARFADHSAQADSSEASDHCHDTNDPGVQDQQKL